MLRELPFLCSHVIRSPLSENSRPRAGTVSVPFYALFLVGNLYFREHPICEFMQTRESRLAQPGTPPADQPKVVIGILAYNNEDVIERIVSPLSSLAAQIFVCDDASTDSTAKIAETLNAKVISHPHRLGVGAGIRSLFLAANQAHADVLVTIPTDSVCDSSSISKLVTAATNRKADIVVGGRTPLRPVDFEGYVNSPLTVYGLPVQDPRSPFKAYNKTAIATIASHSFEKANILPEAKKLNLAIMEYEISAKPLFGKGSNRASAPLSTGAINQLIEFTSMRHPIEFYGGAAIIVLIAALVKSYLAYHAWRMGLGVPDFDVIVCVSLFLIWLMLAMSAAMLYSLSRNVSVRE